MQVVDYATFMVSGRSVCSLGAVENPEAAREFVSKLSSWVILIVDLSSVCPTFAHYSRPACKAFWPPRWISSATGC